MTINQSKKSSENNACKWCNKSFASERTLSAHMCVKKRRWADKDLTHIRLGFRVFQMFYELNTTASKPKSIEDFIQSQYYEGFTKFGRSCLVNEYLKPEQFAEWLIKNGKKLADWSKDKMYVHDIRSAKISPWLLYLSNTGDELLSKFSDEQVKMIQQIIDATFWMKVFAQNKEEVREIKQACEEAQL